MATGLLLAVHFITALTFCGMHTARAKINFIKDQSMDAEFPGPVYKPDPSIPEGHMRPLGWQRQADGPVKEEEGMLSTKEFYSAYMSTNTPAVFRKGVVDAPAFEKWEDDDYLQKKYGDQNVTVRIRTGKRQNKILSREQGMSLTKFLKEYLYEEWYVATEMPEAMLPELPLPACVRCGNIREMLWSSQLWMSSGGTSSRIHSHDDHLLHCVVFGRRDFIVIESYNKKTFDYVLDYTGSLGGHSDLNTEMINMFEHKQVGRVPWTWATLHSGDCIFIPAGYIHQVRSHGRTISFTLEFAPTKHFDDTGCTLMDEDFVALSEANFFWKFKDGKMRLSDEMLTADGLRKLLLTLLGTRDLLSFQHFEHFYHQFAPESTKVPAAREVFDFMLSEEGETVITRVGIMEIPESDLQRIIDVFLSFSRWEGKAGDGRKDRIKHVHEEF